MATWRGKNRFGRLQAKLAAVFSRAESARLFHPRSRQVHRLLPYAWIAIALACLPYLASVGTFLIGNRRRKRTTWIMTTTAAVCLVLAVLLYPAIDDGGVVRE